MAAVTAAADWNRNATSVMMVSCVLAMNEQSAGTIAASDKIVLKRT
jgi:hypothetical protein